MVAVGSVAGNVAVWEYGPNFSNSWVWVSGLIGDGPNTLTHDASGVYYPVAFDGVLYEVNIHIAEWSFNDAQDTVTCDIFYGDCGAQGQITNIAVNAACTTRSAEADPLDGNNGHDIYCVLTVTSVGATDTINGVTVEAFYNHNGVP